MEVWEASKTKVMNFDQMWLDKLVLILWWSSSGDNFDPKVRIWKYGV